MDRLVRKAEEIMRAGDQIIEKKKHRAVMIRRIAVSSAGLCTAIVLCALTLKPSLLFFGDHKGDDELIVSDSTTLISETMTETTATSAQTSDSIVTNITTGISGTNNSITSVTDSNAETHTVTSTTISSDSSTFTTTNSSAVSATESTIVTTSAASTRPSITSTEITTTTNLSFGEEIDSFSFGDIEYSVTNKYLTDDRVLGDKIGNTDLKSQSGIIPSDIYEINGISPNYAVIARTDSPSGFMTGVNNAYLPATMQSLFRDIGLNDYWKTDNKDVNIFEKLLQLPDCKLEQFVSPGKTIIEIKIESEVLCIYDAVLAFTENGCFTYSNGSTYVFCIGKEEVKQIVNELTQIQ